MAINRSEVNRALAKAIAFKACGNDAAARQWARTLVELLECHSILTASVPVGWDVADT